MMVAMLTKPRLLKPAVRSLEAVRLFADAAGGEQGGTTQPAGGAPAAPAAPATPAIDAAALGKLMAEHEATKAELAALKAKGKEADASRSAAEKKALEEQGQFKALAEKHAADLAAAQKRLAELEGPASVGAAFLEREKARVEAVVKDMPAEWRETLDAVGDNVVARGKVIDRYLATTTTPPTAPKAPQGGAPPGSPAGVVDIRAEIAKGRSLDELRRSYPKEVDALLSTQSSSSGSPLASMLRPRK